MGFFQGICPKGERSQGGRRQGHLGSGHLGRVEGRRRSSVGIGLSVAALGVGGTRGQGTRGQCSPCNFAAIRAPRVSIRAPRVSEGA